MLRLFHKPSGLVLLFLLSCAMWSCGHREAQEQSETTAEIFPDYDGVTVPNNIAPLNFEVRKAQRVVAHFAVDGQAVMRVSGKRYIDIPLKKWANLLQQAQGKKVEVTVETWDDGHPKGVRHRSFVFYVDTTAIDACAAYRLIPPGYIEWNHMGLFQRDLTSFRETPIITNETNGKGCLNCHSFCQYDADRFMFHARGKAGGTVIAHDGVLEKVALAQMPPHKEGTYPYWHPSGRFIAFSSNQTRQAFYDQCQDKVEVYDNESDLIVYNVVRKRVLTDERFTDSLSWETFPCFSPDGKWLYFCTASRCEMPIGTESLKYSLVRVPFDETTGKLGTEVDTIYSSSTQGGSVSLPRVSPDGKWLLLTHSSCATFHIQHRDADLLLIDLSTGNAVAADKWNSAEADSYHSWSSNGKWVIFASRRLDGRFTRLFIASFADGKLGKPFLLPQKNPNSNALLLYSYNVPELIHARVKISQDTMAKLFKQ